MNPGKSAGWDGVNPRVIKAVAPELAGSLSRLMNCCMREGHYPECFKIARVVPVFKSEDPTQFSNYRPVSVLPVLSQIFERVMNARLTAFFEKNRVIIPGQYGFRTGHSSSMAIMDMVEKVRATWEDKHVALGVFIDLKKAFDTVDHDILLRKLEHYGIRGVALELLRSYLTSRFQYVSYGGFDSDKGIIKCGVPQGSVLGPLFFLIYVNDMVRACKELELVLFADDTNIFARARNPQELFGKVNKGLQELDVWFRCNKLTLNLKKTEYVYFGGRGGRVVPEGGLRIGGETIRRVEGVRFLGVWVDEGITWKGHIEKVRVKVGQLLGVLGRAPAVLGRRSLQMLYNALVLPHLQYCLMVWGDFHGNHNRQVGDRLLKLQKSLAGLIMGKRGRCHSDPIFAELGMLKIDDLYRQQMRIHAWKFWNGRLPESQANALNKVSDTHGYSTRSARHGISSKAQDHKSIGYRVPREWESLSQKNREVKSLSGFKKNSKMDFIAKYKAFRCEANNCYICGNGHS